MLVIDDLDGANVERAGALVAREHAAARQVRPELPAGFGSDGGTPRQPGNLAEPASGN